MANLSSDRSPYGRSGSSHVALTGSAQDVTIDASGSSDVDLTDLPRADADVNVSGNSAETVNPSGRLGVDAGDASDVYYLSSSPWG
jgi:hypothetical protein